MKPPALKTSASTSATDRPTRTEWMLVIAVVMLGVALRCAFPSRMSVEHFDEGIYASNLAAGEANHYRYPFQHLYAPPFFPSLVEWSMLMLGQTSFAAILVSLVVGGLTPLLVWHAGRRWFGPAAGISAATLAAMSDFHLVYSRAALTDALLCFWFLLAVHLTWEACRRGRPAWAVAAGIATALAWWTKYTGWLPLAVGASGIVPWLIFHRWPQRSAARVVAQWIIIAITAIALWSPWWYSLKEFGGYEQVANNHARYLVGLHNWLPTFIHQASNHRHYSGWLSCAGVSLAVILAGFAAYRTGSHSTWNRSGKPGEPQPSLNNGPAMLIALGSLLTAAAISFGTSAMLGVSAVLGMALWIIPALGSRSEDERRRFAALAAWLTAAWFFGVLVSTPAYHPYPRLTLPWLVASWMGAGALLGGIAERGQPFYRVGESSSSPTRSKTALAGAAIGVIAMIASCIWSGGEVTARGVPAWEDRADLERVSQQVVERARQVVREEMHQDSGTIVMYVYGEAAIFFHVGKSEGIVGLPVENLSFASPDAGRPPVPTFLVAGPPASTSENFAHQWNLFGRQLREVGVFHYSPSDLVLLDNREAKSLEHMAERPREEIRLYLLK